MNMNQIKKCLVPILVIFISTWFVTACSDEPDMHDDNGASDINGQALAKVCTDWGESPFNMEKRMGSPYTFSDGNYQEFAYPANDYTIVYDYEEDCLRSAACIYGPLESGIMPDISGQLKGYQYLGMIDGSAIYSNSSKNILVTAYMKSSGNKIYFAVGFTPIKSDAFETIEPVTTITLEATNITASGFTMNGRVTNVGKKTRCGFEYSTYSDFKESKTKDMQSDCDFSITLTGLDINTTYYYRAFTVFDDIRYEGETVSVTTLDAHLYAVGDFYPDNIYPEGVVVSISENGLHGKIISLDQDYIKWDVNGIFCTDYKCYNSSDGSKNQLPSNQPFGAWVKGHGDGWYGPATNELTALNKVVSTVNTTLRSNSYPRIDGFYWASTCSDNNNAYIVCVTETTYMGYNGGWTGKNSKDNNRSVRAMKKF